MHHGAPTGTGPLSVFPRSPRFKKDLCFSKEAIFSSPEAQTKPPPESRVSKTVARGPHKAAGKEGRSG